MNQTFTGRGLLALAVFSLTLAACATPPDGSDQAAYTETLREGWLLQSTTDVDATGDLISTPEFVPDAWQKTPVPSTVLAALVRNGVFKDVYFGKNLEKIPTDRFDVPWWYRREVDLGQAPLPAHVALVFEGVNYRAEVWWNGERIAELAGAFRTFELDVTPHVKAGKNVLAVEVFPPRPGDFTIGFVDWNPSPPDRNMGLWREVKLRTTGPVSLADTFVMTDVDLETLAEATLSISARLRNHAAAPVTVRLQGAIGDLVVTAEERLGAGEEKTVRLTAAEHQELRLRDPHLWWPHDLGEPYLYHLQLTARVNGRLSDRADVSFGVREVGDYVDGNGYRGYTVNGRKVLIRGGGWVDDLLLADPDERIEDQVRYARHMNLNTLRLEGFWGSSQRLYDLADRYGLLLMAGWSCQWEWDSYLGGPVDDFGGVQNPEQMELVAQSLRDQVVWLRNHPSIFVWVVGSDKLPRPTLESLYLGHLGEVDPTRPVLASCSTLTSEVSGPTGVKMNGPYDYVTPNYWYLDRERGGAYGFNTETGPGPQPPPLESLKKMLPAENLWPIDDMWDYHCGRNEFNTLTRYKAALDARYGPSEGVEEFARKSQVQSYEAMRAMFEAFSLRRERTTGIIQWMFNSAWPEMYWQFFDYYLLPNGAFYGAKTATEPLNLVYDYGDRSVYATNDTASAVEGHATVRLLDTTGRETFSQEVPVTVAAGGVEHLLELPALPSAVAFLDLRLNGPDGPLARDFYWLSKKEDVLDEEGSTWFVTPNKSYADFTALDGLPQAKLEAGWTLEHGRARVTLKNPGDSVAFFVELRIVDPSTGASILPVFWNDNYVTLLPGEERALEASFEGHEAALAYSGWNVAESTIR